MRVADIKLIECPRDAMQGWTHLIPTKEKINYLNQLLSVGFHTLDFGSFVSPKAIPQMADTKDVLEGLQWRSSTTRLLAIIANERGAETAAELEAIQYLGFPFSVSETFQQKNTNSSIAASLDRVKAIQEISVKNGKELVIYISMGFGNPYGDVYNEEIVLRWIDTIVSLGVGIISLADTVGLATPGQVKEMTEKVIHTFPKVEVGVHLHSTPHNWEQKLQAAIDAGCKRIDGALKGIGGCPMADNDLVGNMDTVHMIGWLEGKGYATGIDPEALETALQTANRIFVG